MLQLNYVQVKMNKLVSYLSIKIILLSLTYYCTLYILTYAIIIINKCYQKIVFKKIFKIFDE